MKELFTRVSIDIGNWQQMIWSSQKNPGIIFEEVFCFFSSLFLLLFLTALGKKVKNIFKIKMVGIEDLFYSLALGIIILGSLVLLMGMLSLYFDCLIWTVFIFLLLISLSEIKETVKSLSVILKTCANKKETLFNKLLKIFFFSFLMLNIIGSFTPEKGVDAIGYHLYFPKVYLQEKTMMLPARGSRLFSLFPHLASMIYVLPVSLRSPNIAQLFNMWLGFFSAVIIGLIVNKLAKSTGVFAGLIFYSSIIIGSISRSAYSDFLVTFFCGLGILSLLGLNENKKEKIERMAITGLMLGGALATKNQSLALIPLLVFYLKFLKRWEFSKITKILLFSSMVVSPWYFRSIILSGNPFYPLFSLDNIRVPFLNISYYSGFGFVKHLRVFFLFQPLIFFVFIFLISKNNFLKYKKYIFGGLLIYIYWLFLPESFHDNRYFLPYFLLIILCWCRETVFRNKYFKYIFLLLISFLLAIRFYTNFFYLFYVLGLVDKNVYLSHTLIKTAEGFYDFNGEFSETIHQKIKNFADQDSGRVLISNILGLYYVDFPFTEFEYSPFFSKNMTLNEFKNIWRKNDYQFLLLKNETVTDFFVKMGIKEVNEKDFILKIAHFQSKTFLYEPNF